MPTPFEKEVLARLDRIEAKVDRLLQRSEYLADWIERFIAFMPQAFKLRAHLDGLDLAARRSARVRDSDALGVLGKAMDEVTRTANALVQAAKKTPSAAEFTREVVDGIVKLGAKPKRRVKRRRAPSAQR